MDRKIKILILEDVSSDEELIKYEMKKAGMVFESRRAETKEEYARLLDEFVPDIILSDYVLPAYDVQSAFKLARKKYPAVPFIIVSGRVGDEFAFEVMKLGVTDYVLKDKLQRLVLAVMRALGEAEALEKYRKAQNDVVESESKYRMLMENAGDSILLYDADGKVLESNKKAEQLLGYGRDEMSSLRLRDVHPEMEWGNITLYFNEVLRTGSGMLYGNLVVNKRGEQVPVDLSASRVEVGKTPYVLVLIRDITERKNIEEKIQKYQEVLRLLASELSIVEEKERRALANELHDTIAQYLAISKIKLDMVKQDLVDPGKKKALLEISELLERSIQFTRSLISELSPTVLYELGLEPAVEWLAEQFQEKHRLKVQLIYGDKKAPEAERKGNDATVLDDDIKILLFKAVRELLFNIVKHAKAGSVSVEIMRTRGSISIRVQDDGVGFDPSKQDAYNGARAGGFGLINIRERLNSIGGTITIRSLPGKGTDVLMVVPIEKDRIDRYYSLSH